MAGLYITHWFARDRDSALIYVSRYYIYPVDVQVVEDLSGGNSLTHPQNIILKIKQCLFYIYMQPPSLEVRKSSRLFEVVGGNDHVLRHSRLYRNDSWFCKNIFFPKYNHIRQDVFRLHRFVCMCVYV